MIDLLYSSTYEDHLEYKKEEKRKKIRVLEKLILEETLYERQIRGVLLNGKTIDLTLEED